MTESDAKRFERCRHFFKKHRRIAAAGIAMLVGCQAAGEADRYSLGHVESANERDISYTALASIAKYRPTATIKTRCRTRNLLPRLSVSTSHLHFQGGKHPENIVFEGSETIHLTPTTCNILTRFKDSKFMFSRGNYFIGVSTDIQAKAGLQKIETDDIHFEFDNNVHAYALSVRTLMHEAAHSALDISGRNNIDFNHVEPCADVVADHLLQEYVRDHGYFTESTSSEAALFVSALNERIDQSNHPSHKNYLCDVPIKELLYGPGGE